MPYMCAVLPMNNADGMALLSIARPAQGRCNLAKSTCCIVDRGDKRGLSVSKEQQQCQALILVTAWGAHSHITAALQWPSPAAITAFQGILSSSAKPSWGKLSHPAVQPVPQAAVAQQAIVMTPILP